MQANLQLLADYVLSLSESSAATHRAEDRPLYELYLADAAVLLALVVRGADAGAVVARIDRHERLWGQTFLVGPEHRAPAAAWQRFKAAYGHPVA